jgi:DNA-binding CsgD family transcriptional regulator
VTEGLRDVEVRSLLDVVAPTVRDDTGWGLPTTVLERAYRWIPCDVVWFVDFEERRRETYVSQEYPVSTTDSDPGEDMFWKHYWDSLPCSYPSRGDDRSVTMISDFYTARQLHATGMYVDYFGPRRVEHEVMLCIPAPAGRSRRLIFFRGRGADFNERHRLLLSLLRPHLNELYQRLEFRRRSLPNLTGRQRQLLQLVAAGHSNAQIAERLSISPPTVRKHLENIFERLGVKNRTAAAALAFPDGFVL